MTASLTRAFFMTSGGGINVPQGVIVGWSSTAASIPTGWTRVTSLDGRYVKQIATSGTNPGTTGGGLHNHVYPAHAHTYNHQHGSWGSALTGGGDFSANAGGNGQIGSHTHNASGAQSAIGTSNNSSPTNWADGPEPAHLTVIFIESDGSPAGFPVDCVAWYNGATPTGWVAFTNLDNRLMRGATAGNDGGTQAGQDSHQHTASHDHSIGGTHTHVASLDVAGNTTSTISGPFNGASNHGHALGTSTSGSNPATSVSTNETGGSGDQSPSWQRMRAIQRTGAAEITPDVIAMWLDTLASIPNNWALCDGNNGTPNLSQGRFVRGLGAGAVGDLGGAATHTHPAGAGHTHSSSGTHNHTFTGQSGIQTSTLSYDGEGVTVTGTDHRHDSKTYTAPTESIGTSTSVANTAAANSSNDPLFTAVAYIQYQGV